MEYYDKYSKHSRILAKDWLKDTKISVLPWPTMSLNEKNLENLWRELKVRVHSKHHSNLVIVVFIQRMKQYTKRKQIG